MLMIYFIALLRHKFHPTFHPQMVSAGRRIVTTTSTQAGSRSGPVLRGRGIRRIVTAAPTTTSTEDLPTVQLCDLPSNLTLSDINQIVADAGVGQPVVSAFFHCLMF